MKWIVTLTVLGLALVGCASTSHPSATARRTDAATASAPASTTPVATSNAKVTLTKPEAKVAYTRIVNAVNVMGDTLNNDDQDNLPWSKFMSDAAAYIADIRAMGLQLQSVRWPGAIRAYVTALGITNLPADIQCTKQEMRAGSYAAANTITTQACTESNSATNANYIRAWLGLPPLG
jgi:hypothetical protein